jgi:hypothetical protein
VIAALMLIAVTGWSYWLMDCLMQRAARSARGTTPPGAPAPQISRTTTALGLEDDPDQWQATRGAWTALDERQLIRLLTDAAPINRPATHPPEDTTVAHIECEDTP